MESEVLTFEVELRMFGGGQIREVEVPSEEIYANHSLTLSRIFYHGQNDVTPMALPSVSAGDVIRYYGDRYLIQQIGFRKLEEGECTKKLETLPDILAAVEESLK